MRHPVFAANWKMNQAPADAKAFMKQFIATYPRQQDRQVLFFPPALSISVVVDATKDRPDIAVGVQNIHWEDAGAFTGENSAPMARAAGARFVLVGHSERRHVFGETEEETGRKVATAVRAGLTAMICVGETLAQRLGDDLRRRDPGPARGGRDQRRHRAAVARCCQHADIESGGRLHGGLRTGVGHRDREDGDACRCLRGAWSTSA